jgi:hypothetical protein
MKSIREVGGLLSISTASERPNIDECMVEHFAEFFSLFLVQQARF